LIQPFEPITGQQQRPTVLRQELPQRIQQESQALLLFSGSKPQPLQQKISQIQQQARKIPQGSTLSSGSAITMILIRESSRKMR
jgi:hypothetical protein